MARVKVEEVEVSDKVNEVVLVMIEVPMVVVVMEVEVEVCIVVVVVVVMDVDIPIVVVMVMVMDVEAHMGLDTYQRLRSVIVFTLHFFYSGYGRGHEGGMYDIMSFTSCNDIDDLSNFGTVALTPQDTECSYPYYQGFSSYYNNQYCTSPPLVITPIRPQQGYPHTLSLLV